MGVTAYLVAENLTPVTGLGDPALDGTFDAAGDFDRLIPAFDDTSFVCWRLIDPYDNTVFTAGQIPAFLEELNRLLPQARQGPELNGMLRLRALARLVIQGRDLSLLLAGD